jgi:hypothetical protein
LPALTSPALLAAVARFNAPLMRDFDPAALPDHAAKLLASGALGKLEGSRAGRCWTRAWIFGQLGIVGVFTDFAEERRRLALLDRETISSLALTYGGCLYAQDAARCVRREEVAALRAALGLHYTYVLSRGRFQMQRARDCFTLFMPDAPLPERMAGAGFAALRLCLDDWPEKLRKLAAPRLPEALRGPADKKNLPLLELFWADLKKLLLTEVAPQWQTCFAPCSA